MPVTEKQPHERSATAEEVLGADEAVTMMELLAPHAVDELAIEPDLRALADAPRTELRPELERHARTADLHEALRRRTRRFGTWLLASPWARTAPVVVAIVRAG